MGAAVTFAAASVRRRESLTLFSFLRAVNRQFHSVAHPISPRVRQSVVGVCVTLLHLRSSNCSMISDDSSFLLASQPSLAKGAPAGSPFKSSGWSPFVDESVAAKNSIIKVGRKKKQSKGNAAIELAKRGYERHMRQLEADQRRDKNIRMARSVYRRLESQERLATRQRERLSLQQYCSQPLLYVMDPGVELRISKPMQVGRAIQSRSGHLIRAREERVHPRTLEKMKRADMRAASIILNRFEAEEHMERVEQAERTYKKSLKRGELEEKAAKIRRLEERLGTPFAKARLRRIRTMKRSQANKTTNESIQSPGATRGLIRGSTAPLGSRNQESISVSPEQQHQQSMPQMSRDHQRKTLFRAQTVQGNLSYSNLTEGSKSFRPSTSFASTAVDKELPVWKRPAVAHHHLPDRSGAYQLRKLLSRAKGGEGAPEARPKGFATKRIYPTEVAGLSTLFISRK